MANNYAFLRRSRREQEGAGGEGSREYDDVGAGEYKGVRVGVGGCVVAILYKRMKITAELIQHSPQFTNPLNERQLDLRGYKLTAIENMGATLNFFECIDFSDNELRKLGNFTNLDRLTSVVATNNRIRSIAPDLHDALPNLENLFLMNNKIAELQEVAKLAPCRRLQRLVLANNLVTELPNYRLFVIAHIPSLRILDFAKVTATERREAQAAFPQEDPKDKEGKEGKEGKK